MQFIKQCEKLQREASAAAEKVVDELEVVMRNQKDADLLRAAMGSVFFRDLVAAIDARKAADKAFYAIIDNETRKEAVNG